MEFLLVPVAIIWLLSPWLGLRLARAKGYSDAAGCIGGILLGPLVLLMALMSKKRLCSACKSPVPDSATACAKCGRDLPPA